MTTPAGPVEVPLRTPPPQQRPGQKTSSSSLSQFLATRNGKIAAAAGLVVVYALYRRYKTNSAAAATAAGTGATATSSGAGIPTANTTATDLYSQLEPLVEQASGFTGTQSILQQLQSLQDALTKGQTTGTGTPGGTKQGAGPLYPTQVHAVGQVGQNANLRQYVATRYPTASAQQQAEIVWNTILDPANARFRTQLGNNVIPGGARITFNSAPVK